jgi:hypothetical protein
MATEGKAGSSSRRERCDEGFRGGVGRTRGLAAVEEDAELVLDLWLMRC